MRNVKVTCSIFHSSSPGMKNVPAKLLTSPCSQLLTKHPSEHGRGMSLFPKRELTTPYTTPSASSDTSRVPFLRYSARNHFMGHCDEVG